MQSCFLKVLCTSCFLFPNIKIKNLHISDSKQPKYNFHGYLFVFITLFAEHIHFSFVVYIIRLLIILPICPPISYNTCKFVPFQPKPIQAFSSMNKLVLLNDFFHWMRSASSSIISNSFVIPHTKMNNCILSSASQHLSIAKKKRPKLSSLFLNWCSWFPATSLLFVLLFGLTREGHIFKCVFFQVILAQ